MWFAYAPGVQHEAMKASLENRVTACGDSLGKARVRGSWEAGP